MTRDDIISMAREAGMERVIDVHKDGTRTIELPHPDLLKRFAALVAAAERKACAEVCELLAAEPITLTGKRDKTIWRIASNIASKRCAAAIRARGER